MAYNSGYDMPDSLPCKEIGEFKVLVMFMHVHILNCVVFFVVLAYVYMLVRKYGVTLVCVCML